MCLTQIGGRRCMSKTDISHALSLRTVHSACSGSRPRWVDCTGGVGGGRLSWGAGGRFPGRAEMPWLEKTKPLWERSVWWRCVSKWAGERPRGGERLAGPDGMGHVQTHGQMSPTRPHGGHFCMRFSFCFSLLLEPPNRFIKYHKNVYALIYYKAWVQHSCLREEERAYCYFSFL